MTQEDDSAFETRFQELLTTIAKGALEREQEHRLPHDEIRALLEIGFGTLRLPQDWGGLDWDLPRSLDRLINLASADPNIAHAFRGQFNFVEDSRLASPQHHPALIERLAHGDLVGTAVSERKLSPGQDSQITTRGGRRYLTGVKYYTTGSVFSDWIVASGYDATEAEQLNVIVDAHHPGVEIIDDWDGFGQQLTGSGTTTFTDVPVAYVNHVRSESAASPAHSHQTAFLEIILLSVVAGISAAAARDVVAFLQPRKRTFGVAAVAEPRRNPLVQHVVGEVFGTAQLARSVVLEEARQLDALQLLLREPTISDRMKSQAATEQLVRVYQVQSLVLDATLRAATRLFEVGGATATSRSLGLDRHWRNIRTIATHNPALQRLQQAGNYRLNAVPPAPLGHLEPSDIGLLPSAGSGPDRPITQGSQQ